MMNVEQSPTIETDVRRRAIERGLRVQKRHGAAEYRLHHPDGRKSPYVPLAELSDALGAGPVVLRGIDFGSRWICLGARTPGAVWCDLVRQAAQERAAEPEWADLGELLDARTRFWQCPVATHRQRTGVIAVQWLDRVAVCTAAGCERTSADGDRLDLIRRWLALYPDFPEDLVAGSGDPEAAIVWMLRAFASGTVTEIRVRHAESGVSATETAAGRGSMSGVNLAHTSPDIGA